MWRRRAWIGAGAGLASAGAGTRGGRGERCQRGYKGGKSSLRGEPGRRTLVRRPQRQGGAGRRVEEEDPRLRPRLPRCLS